MTTYYLPRDIINIIFQNDHCSKIMFHMTCKNNYNAFKNFKIHSLIDESLKHDYFDLTRWLINNDYKITYAWDYNILCSLGYNGCLDILKWGIDNDKAWESSVANFATVNGHLDVLKWIHLNGFTWNKNKCLVIANKYNYQHIINWIKFITQSNFNQTGFGSNSTININPSRLEYPNNNNNNIFTFPIINNSNRNTFSFGNQNVCQNTFSFGNNKNMSINKPQRAMFPSANYTKYIKQHRLFFVDDPDIILSNGSLLIPIDLQNKYTNMQNSNRELLFNELNKKLVNNVNKLNKQYYSHIDEFICEYDDIIKSINNNQKIRINKLKEEYTRQNTKLNEEYELFLKSFYL